MQCVEVDITWFIDKFHNLNSNPQRFSLSYYSYSKFLDSVVQFSTLLDSIIKDIFISKHYEPCQIEIFNP